MKPSVTTAHNHTSLLRDIWRTFSSPGSHHELAIAKVGTFLAVLVLCFATLPKGTSIWAIGLAGGLAWISSHVVSAVAQAAAATKQPMVFRTNLAWLLVLLFAVIAAVSYLTGEAWYGLWTLWAALTAAALVSAAPVQVAGISLSFGGLVVGLQHFGFNTAATLISFVGVAVIVALSGLFAKRPTNQPKNLLPDVHILWAAIPALVRATGQVALLAAVMFHVEPTAQLPFLLAALLAIALAETTVEFLLVTTKHLTQRHYSWAMVQDLTMALATCALLLVLSVGTAALLTFGIQLPLTSAVFAVVGLTVFCSATMTSWALLRVQKITGSMVVPWCATLSFAPYALWAQLGQTSSLLLLAGYFMVAIAITWFSISRTLMTPALWLEHVTDDQAEPVVVSV